MGKKPNPTRSKSEIVAPSRGDPTLEIRSECTRSMAVLKRGSHPKALRLMRETLRKHGDSALVHRVHATMHAYLAGLIENSTAKQKHIKSAIESATRATELAPNSIEFAYFYALLLFDHMVEDGGYELVLAECERALCVESPVDPAEQYLNVSKETAASTPEARIRKVQENLKNLVQECNLASISTRNEEEKCSLEDCVQTSPAAPILGILEVQENLKNLVQECNLASISTRNEEEKCDLEYPVPTSPNASSPGRNDEINKPPQTLDERHEEIELCVAAAGQQQCADLGLSPSTTSSGPHSEEEKNHLIPIHNFNEQDEYSVPKGTTAPLPRRYSLIKNATKTLDELRKEIEEYVSAVWLSQQQHAQSSSTTSSQLHNEEEHSYAASAASSSPLSRISKPSSCKLVNSSSANCMDQVRAYWDSMTAERQLSLLTVSIPEMKSHYASFNENVMMDLLSEALSFAEESGSWEFWICFKCNKKFSDAVSHLNHVSAHIGIMSDLAMEAIPEEVNSDWVGMLTSTSLKPIDVESVIRSSEQANIINGNLLKDMDFGNSDYARPVDCLERGVKENGDCSGFEKMECVMRGGDDAGGRLHKWPLSDDPEREKLLEKIQSMFGLMIKHRCLSTRHVRNLLEFANDQIKAYPLPSNVLDVCGEELERTPLGFCFLDASMLGAVFCVLQELCHTGRLQRSSEKDSCAVVADGATKNGADLETLKLDLNSSTLTVGGAEGERGLRDANALFQWIYAGPSIADWLAAWACSKEEKLNQALKLVQTLEKELSLCQTLCEKKLEYLDTLHVLENLREEMGLGCEFFDMRYDHTSDVLSTVKDNLNAELNRLDVEIMRGIAGMHLLELKLGPASLFDYRLEELADKDRSDEAKEAALAELAKNDKKISWKGESKQSNKNSKDKNGSDYRISMSPKGSSMDTVILEERAEKSEVALSDNMGAIKTDEALNQDEDGTKKKVEMEAEERKLEETSEYLRRLGKKELAKTLESHRRIRGSHKTEA